VAHRVAYLLTRSASDADDALQDGAVKAYYALHRFTADRPFRPWFVAIVANEARNRARSGVRREALRLRLPTEVAATAPEDEVVTMRLREDLLRHLEALPPRLRDALSLRYVLELSERETATALGIRPGTVKSRVSRGLEQLRRLLGGDWHD
jgi:RNA polymerase sigma-70 factor (ECF subfamily)